MSGTEPPKTAQGRACAKPSRDLAETQLGCEEDLVARREGCPGGRCSSKPLRRFVCATRKNRGDFRVIKTVGIALGDGDGIHGLWLQERLRPLEQASLAQLRVFQTRFFFFPTASECAIFPSDQLLGGQRPKTVLFSPRLEPGHLDTRPPGKRQGSEQGFSTKEGREDKEAR